jgi:hypothetical protein
MFTPRRTVISLLAAAALLIGATTASARPLYDAPDRADSPTSSLAGTTTPRQDLRGEHARDAARADQIAAQMRSFTPAPLVAPKPAPAPASSDGTPWAIIGISLFAALVAFGGAVMYVRAPRRNTLARS